MRRTIKRVLVVGVTAAVVAAAGSALVWVSLTHEPAFYRKLVGRGQRAASAKRFVSSSLQLRNDIVNEPTWEAVFSDDEVNAWLAEDLVTHFADQLPPEVHEPRVLFELDRVTLAFELDRGPLRSVVWVVARPRVPRDNVLELTFEKFRAGILPVPPDQVLDRIVERARAGGLDVSWKREGKEAVATIRYSPADGRDDVKLERVRISAGELLLAGRSDRSRGRIGMPTLPTRKVLQSKFPNRKVQFTPPPADSPSPTLQTSAGPAS